MYHFISTEYISSLYPLFQLNSYKKMAFIRDIWNIMKPTSIIYLERLCIKLNLKMPLEIFKICIIFFCTSKYSLILLNYYFMSCWDENYIRISAPHRSNDNNCNCSYFYLHIIYILFYLEKNIEEARS